MGVRGMPGTGIKHERRKVKPASSLGVQGAVVARLLPPLALLVRQGSLVASAPLPPMGRSFHTTMQREGQGLTPLHPQAAENSCIFPRFVPKPSTTLTPARGCVGVVFMARRTVRFFRLFPHFFMRDWIRSMFGGDDEERHSQDEESLAYPPFPMVLTGVVENLPAVKVIGVDRVRVCLHPSKEHCEDCQRPVLWLTLEFLDEQWTPVMSLPENGLPIILSVLEDVMDYLRQETQRALEVAPLMPD